MTFKHVARSSQAILHWAEPVIMFAGVFGAWSAGGTFVFYREDAPGILISRILHYRMLPQNYAIDDEDDGL